MSMIQAESGMHFKWFLSVWHHNSQANKTEEATTAINRFDISMNVGIKTEFQCLCLSSSFSLIFIL